MQYYCTWLHTGNFTGTRIGILHESLIMGVCIQEVQTCSKLFLGLLRYGDYIDRCSHLGFGMGLALALILHERFEHTFLNHRVKKTSQPP